MTPIKFNLLIRKFNTDRDAFNQIYDFYYPKVVLHLTRRFGKSFPAEDATQELFLKLVSNKPNEYIRYPNAWIFKLAENTATDFLRKQPQIVSLSDLYLNNYDYEELINDDEVKKNMKVLDALTQKIFYLHFWEGYSFREISEELKLNYNTVRVKAKRGYEKMQKFMKHF